MEMWLCVKVEFKSWILTLVLSVISVWGFWLLVLVSHFWWISHFEMVRNHQMWNFNFLHSDISYCFMSVSVSLQTCRVHSTCITAAGMNWTLHWQWRGSWNSVDGDGFLLSSEIPSWAINWVWISTSCLLLCEKRENKGKSFDYLVRGGVCHPDPL